jgi:hypothetical protein
MAGEARKWSEWDFSSLEAWEVEHSWSYEFTWLLPGLVRRVKDWREKVPKREGQDLFEAYLSHQGGRASSFIQIGDNLFLIPPGAYYLFPEWPATPYLKIPSKVRFQRLKKLSEDEKDRGEPREPHIPEGPAGTSRDRKERDTGRKGKATSELREIDPHPGRYRLDPVSYMETEEQTFHLAWDDDAWERFTESLRKSILRSNEMRVFRSDSEELAILRIPWTLSDKQILVLLSKWLAGNRPIPFRKQGTLGRSHRLAKKRTELEYLRKYLIVQDAGTWEVTVGGARLFRDRSKWNACRKVVEKILTDLGSYPGCTS